MIRDGRHTLYQSDGWVPEKSRQLLSEHLDDFPLDMIVRGPWEPLIMLFQAVERQRQSCCVMIPHVPVKTQQDAHRFSNVLDPAITSRCIELAAEDLIELEADGMSSEVWRGRLEGRLVAVKKLKKQAAAASTSTSAMAAVEGIAHDRYVKILGVTWTTGRDIALIFEWMPKNDPQFATAFHTSTRGRLPAGRPQAPDRDRRCRRACAFARTPGASRSSCCACHAHPY